MAGPPTADWAEMTLYFAGDSLPSYAACTLGLSSPSTGFADSGWQADLSSALTDLVQLTCHTGVTLQGYDLKVGPVATGPTYGVPVGEAGALTGNPAGPQTSYLIRKSIEGVSTRFAGRLFWPVPTIGNISASGTVLPGALTALQDAFDGFYDALVLLTSEPVVFSNSSDPRPVIALTVQSQIATQRRRNRR